MIWVDSAVVKGKVDFASPEILMAILHSYFLFFITIKISKQIITNTDDVFGIS
jgi:hypothetical protein